MFRMFVALKLRAKILSIPSVMVGLMLITGGVVYLGLMKVNQVNIHGSTAVIPQVEIVNRLYSDTIRLEGAIGEYLLFPTAESILKADLLVDGIEEGIFDLRELELTNLELEMVAEFAELNTEQDSLFTQQLVFTTEKIEETLEDSLKSIIEGDLTSFKEIADTSNSLMMVRLTLKAVDELAEYGGHLVEYVNLPSEEVKAELTKHLRGLEATYAEIHSFSEAFDNRHDELFKRSEAHLKTLLKNQFLIENLAVEKNRLLGEQQALNHRQMDDALRLQESAKRKLISNAGAMDSAIRNSLLLLLIGIFGSAFLGGALSWLVSQRIVSPINKLSNLLGELASTGNFSLRAPVKGGNDEVMTMSRALNDLLDTLGKAVSEINTTMSAVSQGDFSSRVSVSVSGDLNTLKSGVNESADSVQNTMNALDSVMEALYNGNLSARMDDRVQGESKRKVDQALVALEDAFGDIRRVMGSVSQGDFSDRINAPLRGDLNTLKEDVNASIAGLEDAFSEISSVMGEVSQGNLATSLEGVYQGDFAKLTGSINTTVATLSEVMEQINESTESVSAGVNELTEGNFNLSTRTEAQAESLEQTASSMEEITTTVKQNADNASEANQLVIMASGKAVEGGEVVQDAVRAMQAINDSSKRIVDIISVIDEIAFQTNLLALNASVEAARAGEQGRGFAVVAGEVRTLAGRSATAAQEIKVLIEDSVGKVDEGSLLVERSGVMLQEIVDGIQQVTGIVGEIATASNEQSSGIAQINSAIVQIDDATRQNTALVEEAAVASELVGNQGQRLRSLVSFFNLRNTNQANYLDHNSVSPRDNRVHRSRRDTREHRGSFTANS